MSPTLRKRSWLVVVGWLGLLVVATGHAREVGPHTLWYDKPAGQWVEALPVGNGTLAAMVFGHPERERLQLNEGTLWAGGPYDPVNPGARAAMPRVRQLVNDGKFREAAALVDADVIAKPRGQMPYQTVGDLRLEFPHASFAAYRRELDLATAVTTTRYEYDGVRFVREVFASAPEGVIVMRLGADQPGRITFGAGMDTPMRAQTRTEGGDTLVMRGKGGDAGGIPGALAYEARVKIIPRGGKVVVLDGRIKVDGADEVLVLITAATSFRRFDDVGGDPAAIVARRFSGVAGKSFDRLLADHLADYQPLFGRVSLDFGRTAAADLPTDERIRRFAGGGDPALAALYYQFGRYLLISCSRPGGQPATLQGLWNESLNPPWQSKYTININTEMNYWPAESGSLPECVEPLIRMVEELTVTGARTARAMYDARGWVVHHNTDLWRATAPIDGPNWGMWPTGGAWLCLHLWDRYEFSADPAVLRRVYPVLKGACEFFLDTLQETPDGKWLVTNPSISPENMHPHGAAVCAGPTMDMQILRDLFGHTIRAARLLGVDASLQAQLAKARARLAPNRIGGEGQLQEWFEDWDLQAPERRHRHVSHLYGLYPGRDIHRRDTPALADAVRKSLDLRGDKATGWATAWRIGLWAHLADGDRAFRILSHLISPQLTYPNLFDAHPPFQIDGNFGGAAAIAEMMVQSRIVPGPEGANAALTREIEFLPALPKAWPSGSLRGLRARGGIEVDVTWQDGVLAAAVLRSAQGGRVRLIHGPAVREQVLKPGTPLRWDGK